MWFCIFIIYVKIYMKAHFKCRCAHSHNAIEGCCHALKHKALYSLSTSLQYDSTWTGLISIWRLENKDFALWLMGFKLGGGHERDDHQPDRWIFLSERKKPLSFTRTKQHFHFSLSPSLILTCQISRSLSLTGSPTHNCVFSQRGERKKCELQACDVCVLCSLTLINRYCGSGQKNNLDKVCIGIFVFMVKNCDQHNL